MPRSPLANQQPTEGASSYSGDSSAARSFWIFLLVHVVLWTALPILFHPNAPLDVVEEISWGREWQWGYYKHPPLAAWLANAVYLLSGGKLGGIFLLSQLSIGVCFVAVWKLARNLLDETRALAAVVLLEGTIYYNFTSAEFNPNVLELPLWALVVYFAWRAANRRRVIDWVLLGLFAGLGMLTKYYTAFLLFPVSVAIVAHPNRSTFKGRPWISAAVALCVFIPHLLWIVANRFSTLSYAVDRASAKKTLVTHLTYPVNFTASQMLAVLLTLAAFTFLYKRAAAFWLTDGKPSRFLQVVVLGPFGITLLLSLVMNWKLRSMWGTPLWTFLPLLLLLRAPRSGGPTQRRRVLIAGYTLSGIMACAFVLPLVLGPYLSKKPRKALFDGRYMSEQITQDWRRQTAQPLRVVAGDTWLAGNLAFYSSDRPSTFTEANPKFSQWITPELLARSGAVIIWQETAETPVQYRSVFPDAQIQPPIRIPWHTRKALEPATVYWAIVPPRH